MSTPRPWRSRRSRRCARGATSFVPKNWEKTYFEWMENIQPWCISRQLWWGHQIPGVVRAGRQGVRRRDRGRSGRQRARLLRRAGSHHAKSRAARWREDPAKREGFITRDEDVLDTWFSSGLWPFSTLGWPDDDAGSEALLPDQRARHRLGHHLLLGRPDDDDGPALHEGCAVLDRLHPPPGSRREGREDVEVERQRHRSPAASSTTSAPTRCALRWRAARRTATTSSCRRNSSKPIAISRPSCGTPAASPR